MAFFIERLEKMLRIDAKASPESLMRIRAVYAVGGSLVVTQVVNIAIVNVNYGRWTYDATLIAAVCATVAALVAAVRYYKNTAFYAAAYSTLVLGGTLASATIDHGGINTAMMPFVSLGPMMCGLIAGRRAALGFFAAGAALLCFLYYTSISSEPLMASGDFTRETNRFAQGLFALGVSTVISVFISERIYALAADLQQAADLARRAEAAKSDFLATMSHELRTPLNGIVGLADALRRADLPPHERALAQTISRSGESLTRILNDVLDLSKIEAGKLAIDPRPASVRALVRHVAEAWRETARAKGLTIAESVNGDAPEFVMIDDLRVAQILQNLISNAVKFTGSGPVLLKLDVIPLDGDRYRLEFRVTDSGSGVPDNMIERIFERFDQGASDTTRRYGGTGLGLPICRQLATLMSGAIGVEKTGPNGSTFLLTINADAVPAKIEAAEPEPASYAHLSVLAADDNNVNRMVLNEFLKGWGVEADFAVDGAACVDMAAGKRYDLILLDKDMPMMTGLDAARAIRKAGSASAGAIIIAVTGDAAESSDREYIAAGIDDRIVKPVSRAAVGEALKRVNACLAAA